MCITKIFSSSVILYTLTGQDLYPFGTITVALENYYNTVLYACIISFGINKPSAVNLVDFIRYFNDTFYVFRFRRSIDLINTNEKYRVSNVFIEKRV